MTIENFPARRRTLYAGVGFEAARAFSARQNRVHVLAGNDKKSTEKKLSQCFTFGAEGGI